MLRNYTLEIETSLCREEIAMTQRSEGAAPYIAWHGMGGVNRLWLWDSFWELGRVDFAGLPGHGPVQRYGWDHYLAWTPQHFIDVGIATLRTLYAGQPATVIGHSTGGMVALGVALQAPELVSRAILISPVIWHELSGTTRLWTQLARYPRWTALLMALTTGLSRVSWVVFYIGLHLYLAESKGLHQNPRVIQVIRDGHADYRKTSYRALVGTARVLRQADLRPTVLARPLQVPTLLIHGTRDGAVPLAQSQWLADHSERADLVTLPGAGHICYAEHEPEVTELIMRWCNTHPQ